LAEHRFAQIGLGIGVVAAAPETAFTEETVAAADRKRHDYSLPYAQLVLVDVRANLLDDTHWLVPEDIAGLHKWYEPIDKVKVRSANAGRRHAYDRIAPIQNLGFRHVLDTHLVRCTPYERFHLLILGSS
jgi:hypothetical protein